MRRSTLAALAALAVGLAFAAVAYLASARLKPPPRRRAMYGGKMAAAGQWPYVAALIGNKKLCTGFLIDPKYVMTAKHCADPGSAASPGGIVLIDGKKHTVIKVYRTGLPVALPPGLPTGTVRVQGDWAIVELDMPSSAKPVKVNGWQASIKDADVVAKDLWAAGFGEQPGKRPQPQSSVQEALVRVVLNSAGNYVSQSLMAQRGACHGDSGGPLVLRSPTAGDVVVGITSAMKSASGDPNTCGPSRTFWVPTRPVLEQLRRERAVPFPASAPPAV
jgi:hypothetical protein